MLLLRDFNLITHYSLFTGMNICRAPIVLYLFTVLLNHRLQNKRYEHNFTNFSTQNNITNAAINFDSVAVSQIFVLSIYRVLDSFILYSLTLLYLGTLIVNGI